MSNTPLYPLRRQQSGYQKKAIFSAWDLRDRVILQSSLNYIRLPLQPDGLDETM